MADAEVPPGQPPTIPGVDPGCDQRDDDIAVLDTGAAAPTAIRGAVIRGVGYGAGLLLAVVSLPLVVRHLGVVDFGRYTVVMALITLISGLTEMGIQTVGTREFAVRKGSARDRLMANLLGVRIAVTSTGVLAALAFVVLAGYDRVLVLGTAVAGAGLLLQSVQTLLAVPLVASLRFGWVTALELGRQVITVTLTVTLVVVGASLLPFFAVAIPAAAVVLGVTAAVVRAAMPFRPAFSPREWWGLLKDSAAYAVAIAVNVAYYRLAVIILSLLATGLETGYFSASFRVVEVLLPLPALVIGSVFPILARAAEDRRRLALATRSVLEVAVIAGAATWVALHTGAGVIISVIAGAQSRPSVDILQLQAPAVAATFVAVAGSYTLLSLRHHRALLWANLTALAMSLLLTLALVPGFGGRGAAVATTAAECALAFVTILLLTRALPGIGVGLRVLVGVALAAAAGFVSGALVPSEVVSPMVALVAFAAVVLVTGAAPRELLGALRRPRTG